MKSKKSKQSLDKVQLNKQQIYKVVPFNKQIMSNILGKVYIDKEDKGVQAELEDIIAENESPRIADKISENYKMLKRVK